MTRSMSTLVVPLFLQLSSFAKENASNSFVYLCKLHLSDSWIIENPEKVTSWINSRALLSGKKCNDWDPLCLYSDKCAWSVVGKLKPLRRFKVFFESTSTCSRQTAESPLSANWNSTTTRLPCHFPPKYPAFANSAVLRCKAILSYL